MRETTFYLSEIGPAGRSFRLEFPESITTLTLIGCEGLERKKRVISISCSSTCKCIMATLCTKYIFHSDESPLINRNRT